jgi:hypothetical protein
VLRSGAFLKLYGRRSVVLLLLQKHVTVIAFIVIVHAMDNVIFDVIAQMAIDYMLVLRRGRSVGLVFKGILLLRSCIEATTTKWTFDFLWQTACIRGRCDRMDGSKYEKRKRREETKIRQKGIF